MRHVLEQLFLVLMIVYRFHFSLNIFEVTIEFFTFNLFLGCFEGSLELIQMILILEEEVLYFLSVFALTQVLIVTRWKSRLLTNIFELGHIEVIILYVLYFEVGFSLL